MSDSDFENVFGTGHSGRAPFAERVGRTDPARPNGTAASAETAGSGAYKPYGFMPAGGTETCEIVSWVPGTLTSTGIDFQYRFLVCVGFVGEEQLKLFLPDSIVVIEGTKLLEIRKKLARRQVTFIAEYSAKVWPERPPKGETVIEKIAIVRPDSGGGSV